MSIFEQATRRGLRFPSPQGDLTVEQLWDLPLKSEKLARASLNQVAQHVDGQLSQQATKNFVDDASPLNVDDALKLEVVKHIIGVRKAENAAAAKRVADKAELDLLTSLLAEKQNDELKGMSKDELLARIQALRSAS